MPTRKVYVTLVYLFLFAVALLCCDMQYSWSGQSALRYALLTFADNTCLLDVSLHRTIISIHFPLIYAIWWALLRSHISKNGWQRRVFSFNTHTHTHTEARVTSQWGHKHTNTSPEMLWESLNERFIWIKLSSYHIYRKVFTSSRQNKSRFLEDSAAEISIQHNVHNNTTTKIMKTIFLRHDYTTFPTCFNINSKFPLFAKKVCLKIFKINEIDELCLNLITEIHNTEFLRKNKTFNLAI